MNTKMDTGPVRAGIYLRLSNDPQGTQAAVARQEIELREMCAELGWAVTDVYVDNDTSAFSGKPRKNYDRLLADVESGAIDAIGAWHNDRLHRRSKELLRFIEVVNAHGTKIAVRKGGVYDLTTPAGRLSAKIVGDVAEYESDHKSERLRSWWRQRHERGTAYGSHRPFGWTDPKRSAVVQEEADLIREGVRRVLAGEALASIARDWNRRGLMGANGAPWKAPAVRTVLASAAISGRQERHTDGERRWVRIGRVMGPATWPAIVSVEDSDRVRAKLADPSRRTHIGRPSGLLLTGKTGAGRCGACGAPLYGKLRKRWRADGLVVTPSLACFCGQVMIVNAPVERIVSEAVLRAVDNGALVKMLKTQEDREALAELAEVEQQMVQDRADWAAGTITRAEWEKGRAVLQARKTGLEKRIERSRRSLGLEGLPAGPLREAWDAEKGDGTPVLSLIKKRAVIAALIESVTIAPSTAHGFQPERIAIKWRG